MLKIIYKIYLYIHLRKYITKDIINIILTNESYSNSYDISALEILSIMAILTSICVILIKSPIISVLFLILLFITISIYLLMLGMHFIGLSYLLVYVGAVSILFLFILMLINVRVSEIITDNNNSFPLSVLVATLFNVETSELLFSDLSIIEKKQIYDLNSDKVYYVSYVMWDKNLYDYSHIKSLGNIIYTDYQIWIIIISKILLLSMIGSIVITLKRKIKI